MEGSASPETQSDLLFAAQKLASRLEHLVEKGSDRAILSEMLRQISEREPGYALTAETRNHLLMDWIEVQQPELVGQVTISQIPEIVRLFIPVSRYWVEFPIPAELRYLDDAIIERLGGEVDSRPVETVELQQGALL